MKPEEVILLCPVCETLYQRLGEQDWRAQCKCGTLRVRVRLRETSESSLNEDEDPVLEMFGERY